ncbi:hypothetical protein KOW79_009825 [Hemibagrus wyckioides]|uniref:Uncharacterized protein n=1 Tax=Hemibagrus wyckioides TaxID=337641 RepID=A0A9D3NQ33_9TELE|nr:hypothetical protein KOW79_009825 [Hemibagrus wyckioides]
MVLVSTESCGNATKLQTSQFQLTFRGDRTSSLSNCCVSLLLTEKTQSQQLDILRHPELHTVEGIGNVMTYE